MSISMSSGASRLSGRSPGSSLFRTSSTCSAHLVFAPYLMSACFLACSIQDYGCCREPHKSVCPRPDGWRYPIGI